MIEKNFILKGFQSLILVVSSGVLFAQNVTLINRQRDTLLIVEHQLRESIRMDSLAIENMITIWNNPETNDSVRVEIAYLIKTYPHPKGVELLLNEIERTLGYGSGANSEDQFNTYACYYYILELSLDGSAKWQLLESILNVLKKEERSEIFLIRLYSVLENILYKEGGKIFLENALDKSRLENKRKRNFIYENNLIQLLKH
jgi:hypothetical protein